MNSLEFLPSVKEFYSGADILITGATGFFGRGLVEKLLSSCAEINKIYIVLRKRGNQNVQTRIKEFEDCEVRDFYSIGYTQPLAQPKLLQYFKND